MHGKNKVINLKQKKWISHVLAVLFFMPAIFTKPLGSIATKTTNEGAIKYFVAC